MSTGKHIYSFSQLLWQISHNIFWGSQCWSYSFKNSSYMQKNPTCCSFFLSYSILKWQLRFLKEHSKYCEGFFVCVYMIWKCSLSAFRTIINRICLFKYRCSGLFMACCRLSIWISWKLRIKKEKIQEMCQTEEKTVSLNGCNFWCFFC